MLMLNSLRNESSHVARVKTLFAHQVHNVSPNTPKIARVLCYVTDSYFVLFPCHVVSAMFLCYDVFVVLKFFPCCLFCHVLDSLFAVMHLSSWICCNVFHMDKITFWHAIFLILFGIYFCNAVFVILFSCCILCHVSNRHSAMLFAIWNSLDFPLIQWSWGYLTLFAPAYLSISKEPLNILGFGGVGVPILFW